MPQRLRAIKHFEVNPATELVALIISCNINLLIVLTVNATVDLVDHQTSHQKGLNMGPLRVHTTPNNSQGDLRLPSLHKSSASLPRHVFVSSFATKALIYFIHNVILFSKYRGGLFPVMDCRKPPKMHTAAKNIIPHKCPPTAADQTEICDGGISVNEPGIFKHFLQNFIWQVVDV